MTTEPRAGTIAIPEPLAATGAKESIPATSTADLEEAVAVLRRRAPGWNQTDVRARIELLDRLIETTLAAAPAWVAAAAIAKGIDLDSQLAGEDWISGPAPVLRNLSLLRRTLSDIERTGSPQPPAVTMGDNAQVAVQVLPADPLDRILFTGVSAEVRLQPGVTVEQTRQRMGRIYREGYGSSPQVALVLGAGNVSSIPLMDVLYQLLANDRVVVLKMNPVNEHLGPHFGEAFAPLVEAGFLRIVYGGAEVGQLLTDHDEIDAIHMTGSDKTYEAVVFGAGEQGRERKERGEPRIDKTMTSELGNVTPVIVVPGPWSDRDLAWQGRHLAAMLTNNAGFNCVAARVIVQHRAWAKRRALLESVRAALRDEAPRVPYYPGARQRWEVFKDAYGHAEVFGPDGQDEVPFTLIPELEPDTDQVLAFQTEAFCGVASEVAIDTARSVPEYLDAAVAFCNGSLWGTLGATILVHPRSLTDPLVAEALERAIDDLEYGTVLVNQWPGIAYGLVSTTWGAYPGATPTDIQSGTGVVHNSYLLEDVQKTVVRGPFRAPTTPVWFPSNRSAARIGPVLAELSATGAKRLVPRLLFEAARG